MKSKLWQIWQRDKKQALWVLAIAAIISFFLEIAIGYREFPLVAMGQSAFYFTLLNNFLLLGVVPIAVAYISGQLLSLVAVLIRDKKRYQPQYFVAWLLLVTFTYYIAMMAIHKHNALDSLVEQCEDRGKQRQSNDSCERQAIIVYPQIQRCLVYPIGKKRRQCLAKAIK